MTDLIKAVILGIVEGITEFLPISSTGHLIVAAELLDFRPELRGTFEIFIQFGAVVAVVLYYRVLLVQRAKAAISDPNARRFWLVLFIACVPAGLLGVFFLDQIKAVLFNPTVVAISLIVGGIIFLVIERRDTAHKPAVTDVAQITFRQAGIIGLAQTLSVIPGVSRSGASIVGGLLGGLDRRTATEFSFFLAIPMLGSATLYDLFRSLDVLQSDDLLYLLVGAVVSGIVAWLSIGWLLRFVSRNSFLWFGYYRILAGVVILALVAAHLL
jgi:undecaprenyl-diphosphatase